MRVELLGLPLQDVRAGCLYAADLGTVHADSELGASRCCPFGHGER